MNCFKRKTRQNSCHPYIILIAYRKISGLRCHKTELLSNNTNEQIPTTINIKSELFKENKIKSCHPYIMLIVYRKISGLRCHNN